MTTKIKIRLKSGDRIAAKAYPTSHPLLFVTPMRIKKEYSPTKRARFSEEEWSITHKPSGYSIAHRMELDDALRLAELFAKSKIPWRKLRSKKQSISYQSEYNRVMKAFR